MAAERRCIESNFQKQVNCNVSKIHDGGSAVVDDELIRYTATAAVAIFVILLFLLIKHRKCYTLFKKTKIKRAAAFWTY